MARPNPELLARNEVWRLLDHYTTQSAYSTDSEDNRDMNKFNERMKKMTNIVEVARNVHETIRDALAEARFFTEGSRQ